uniref:hypothetical protein n=1 Tax=Klebsiella pneumoniae TaxID=573 RepID=UPI003B97D9AF
AVDSAGNRGIRSAGATTVTPPTTVPTTDGDLRRPAGQSGPVTQGSTVRITGSGYARTRPSR